MTGVEGKQGKGGEEGAAEGDEEGGPVHSALYVEKVCGGKEGRGQGVEGKEWAEGEQGMKGITKGTVRVPLWGRGGHVWLRLHRWYRAP